MRAISTVLVGFVTILALVGVTQQETEAFCTAPEAGCHS
jgi:hypothetical protein